MLTIFSVPKPFEGEIGAVQRTAITSWTRLGTDSEVLLFGDEEGTAEAASEIGVTHVAALERNQRGTPLLNGLFGHAAEIARNPVLCFVNADVILLDDLLTAAQRTARWSGRFLMIGECMNVDPVDTHLFSGPDPEADVRLLAAVAGTPRGHDYLDYFVFPKDLYPPLPPFVIGRAGFDNWLVWKARSLGAAVVDATSSVTALHQRHDYSHLAGGADETYAGADADENRALATGRYYTLLDATHELRDHDIRRRRGSWLRLRFRLHRLRLNLGSAKSSLMHRR